MPKKLWKTTVVIWSAYDPQDMELSDLARDAESGESICTKQVAGFVENPEDDPDWDGNEFFDDPDDDDFEVEPPDMSTLPPEFPDPVM